jgi:hypothetical protein
MYVLAYVDDLIIVSSSKLATTHLLQQLDHEFVIKDMDHLHYFLGIEVQASSSGLLLSQRTYIQEQLTIEHWTTVKLSVSYAISSLPAMMVFASHGLHRSCSVHSLTWTGQDARMIVDQLEACLCSLVLT